MVIKQTQQCALQTPAAQGWFALMALQSQRMLMGTHSYTSKKLSPFPCLPACLQPQCANRSTYRCHVRPSAGWRRSLHSHRLWSLQSPPEAQLGSGAGFPALELAVVWLCHRPPCCSPAAVADSRLEATACGDLVGGQNKPTERIE